MPGACGERPPPTEAALYHPQCAHFVSSLISLGTGHVRNWSCAPNIHLQAALPATRPTTTQSNKELPPRRLLPWTPPAISPAAYRPGIALPSAPHTAESTSISKPPMQ